ncbi:unnamed protein product [Malus baccata var. baccata]
MQITLPKNTYIHTCFCGHPLLRLQIKTMREGCGDARRMMRKKAALLLVLWLAMSMGSWGQDKLKGGLGLKAGGAASKPTERAKKVSLVQKFMDGALYSRKTSNNQS